MEKDEKQLLQKSKKRIGPLKRFWLARFWDKVDKTDSCWLWTGKPDPKGYGRFKLSNRSWRAHRVSWLIHFQDPGDLFVCHSCDNPICVNPEHLFLGTHQDNMNDMYNKGRGKKAAGAHHGLVKNKGAAQSGEKHWSVRHPEKTSKGEAHGLSTLTEEVVLEIRRRYDSGESNKNISESLGIHKSTVSKIGLRQRWKHLK
jgi:hypothetical protein